MKLALFYLSCFMAFVAGHITNYSAIMYSLEAFNSSSLAGLAYAFCFGPPIVFGWVAGAYIDRYSAKRVLLLSQNVFILGVIGMLLVVTYQPDYSVLLFLMANFVVGIGWAFVAPARMSALAQYVSSQDLPKASITFNLLIMIGYGLAPIVLTQVLDWTSWTGVLTLSMGLFICSSLLLINAPNEHERISHDNLKEEWLQCYQGLKDNPIIAQLLITAVIGYTMMGPMQVILPQIAEHNLGLATVQKGWYLGLIALSLIIGGIVAMKLRSKVPVGKSVLAILFICGIGVGLIGLIDSLWLSCIVLIITVGLSGIAVSFIVAGLQQLAPTAIRGRVLSIYTIISQVISAGAGLFAGWIGQVFSLEASMGFVAFCFITGAIVMAVRATHLKGFRSL